MQRRSLGLVAIIAIPGLFFGLIFSMLLLLAPAKPAAATCGPAVSVVTDADTKVEGYTQEQLKNAAAILGAGKSLDLSVKGQMISVMVSLGESGLRVLDYGDGPGPDSRGLFQQRDNGAWGSYADRMDPTTSATNFIQALQAVPGWELLEPTIAGNKVQRNADPYHYQKYWDAAVAVTGAVSGVTGLESCLPGSGIVSTAGDDLPWLNAPFCPIGGSCPPGAVSPLGMYNRECVDFALFRVNQQLGSTEAPFKYTNSNFRPDGALLGSARTWKAGWDAKGWPTGTTPKVGAVVWYAPGVDGHSAVYGHVAIVKAVNADGTFLEEGYNSLAPPDDHKYYTRDIPVSAPSGFLYLPTQEEKK